MFLIFNKVIIILVDLVRHSFLYILCSMGYLIINKRISNTYYKKLLKITFAIFYKTQTDCVNEDDL